mmetsp:Transcript_88406/g.285557  ORF Transcript_88406/g.285557 Transcript_88406/m.285557 type:complete len:159 (-) Transcript_88406:86-562(-)
MQSWVLFATFVSVDIIEHGCYLYCFHKGQPNLKQRRDNLASNCRASDVDLKEEGAGGSSSTLLPAFYDGSSASVAAVLVLRELADVLVPGQFFLILSDVLDALPEGLAAPALPSWGDCRRLLHTLSVRRLDGPGVVRLHARRPPEKVSGHTWETLKVH